MKQQYTATELMREGYDLEFDSGDPWGSVMKWRFDIAEELDRRGEACPEAWQYRSGAMGPPEPEEWDFPLNTVPTADLVAFGNELADEAEALRAAGRDY